MDLNFDIIINILLILLIIISGFMIAGYNELIRKRNRVEEAESNIQIYLKERFDLVPNLVEVVKGYTKHESETLEDVTKTRQNYNSEGGFSVRQVDAAEKSIDRLIAVAESYPNLKADGQYLNLSHKLSSIEDEIEHARRIYNYDATDYNTKIQTVPFSVISKIFNFRKKDLFKVESEDEREPVKVKM